jgi:ribonucleoside-diphosphate reductase alpha chain
MATALVSPIIKPLIERHFSNGTVAPEDTINWQSFDAQITNDKGEAVFEQKGILAPSFWSQQAVNIVAHKYFRGKLGDPARENSVLGLVNRVVHTIRDWGLEDGYFASDEACVFEDELKWLLLNQYASFNSPVWFNVGIEKKPQCSACFILKVEDSMESILDWYKTEGLIFKNGSGAGVNISALRSKNEFLSGGGQASGPLSFMKAADASAGVIKSGGKTRRAAKMVIMDVDHPDILDFINCKVEEERKARALIAAGYDASLDGPAYGSVAFQNANNSVRVTDEFMRLVEEDGDWSLNTRTFDSDGKMSFFGPIKAEDIFHAIAEAAWTCGDPGIQFDTTINKWHTCPNSGRINASNPCSEYMHLDNSACNLASINLLKFLSEDGSFDIDGFKHCVDVFITAMDILVDRSSYPTPEIEKNARDFRQLGLGYANLGAALMAQGLPYDSNEGRYWARAITALMTGEAYAQSARLARRLGPFRGFEQNCEPMTDVIHTHYNASEWISEGIEPDEIHKAAAVVWREAFNMGERCGWRNSQATVLAPTGTIGFMMDCATTGIEPDIALVKYKKLVGGGSMKIVNGTVERALRKIGTYTDYAISRVLQHIEEQGTVEGCEFLQSSAHLPIFDCAFRPVNGTRSISWEGHIKMMGAVQPFLSGAISKTVNMPADATVEDVERAFMLAWKEGVKAIAIYRDGSKGQQPVSVKESVPSETKEYASFLQPIEELRLNQGGASQPVRRKLPNERQSITKKFRIAGHDGYIHVGLYEDGEPGELFLKMSKEGSTLSGLLDVFATTVSYALQYGVPLQDMVDKFKNIKFEPAGYTGDKDIPYAHSIADFVFRWLEWRFLRSAHEAALDEMEQRMAQKPSSDLSRINGLSISAPPLVDGQLTAGSPFGFVNQSDAPLCSYCGNMTVRNGSCYRCMECGSSSGCS